MMKSDMSDEETTMYKILDPICKANAPIVFKGALIIELILVEHDYTKLEKQTRDIDENWIGRLPTYVRIRKHVEPIFGIIE